MRKLANCVASPARLAQLNFPAAVRWIFRQTPIPPKAPPAPPAPARVSTLLDWVPCIRAIAVKCDLCSFDEQGPACVRMCPTKALHLVDNTDIARVSKRKRELTFNTDFGDLTLFQQAQSGEAK